MTAEDSLILLADLAPERLKVVRRRAQTGETEEALTELADALDRLRELRRLLGAAAEDTPADRLDRLLLLEAEILDRCPRCRGPLQ